jgi:NitT/TauT family transport system permease protein
MSSTQTTTAEAANFETKIDDIAPASQSNKLWMVRLASIAFVLIGWEVLGSYVNPLFLSSPTAIMGSAVRMVENGELFTSILSSSKSFLWGFGIASVSGIILGYLIGRYREVDAATDWLVNALYSMPHVALVPLVILWFGLGSTAKIFLVSTTVVFPVLINTISGVRNVPAGYIDVGNAFNASEFQTFRKIIFPSALPFVMTGLRLGIGRGIIAMVVAEFFTAITGLGALIVKYGNQYDTASMFVPILVLMALGVTLSTLVRRLELMIAPWRTQED